MPTDFPSSGDDQKISLRNSNFPQFDYDYALRIKDEHPEIWKKGGNEFGNQAFVLWGRARDNDESEAVQNWIKRRERFANRHQNDFRLPGVVANMKWGVVVNKGISHMKKVISEEIARLKEKEVTKKEMSVRIIHKQNEQQYTLGVVYEPGVVDSQGDYADAEEIEKACHDYMKRLQDRSQMTKTAIQLMSGILQAMNEDEEVRVDVTDAWDQIENASHPLNDMHEEPFTGEQPQIVECYLAPVDFQLGTEKVKKGTWLMGIIWPPDYWEKIKRGERTGLSMEGTGRRIEMNGSETG